MSAKHAVRFLNKMIDQNKGTWPSNLSADGIKYHLNYVERNQDRNALSFFSSNMMNFISFLTKQQTGQTVMYIFSSDRKYYFIDMAGIVARTSLDLDGDMVIDFKRKRDQVQRVLYIHPRSSTNLILEPTGRKSIQKLVEEAEHFSEKDKKRQQVKHFKEIESDKELAEKRQNIVGSRIWNGVYELHLRINGSSGMNKPRKVSAKSWETFKEIATTAATMSSTPNRQEWYKSLPILDKFVVDEVLEATGR